MSNEVQVVYEQTESVDNSALSGPEHVCKSCGHVFKGYYCNVCGEKVLVASPELISSIRRKAAS